MKTYRRPPPRHHRGDPAASRQRPLSPAKRILNDVVTVTAAVFTDGHDHIAGRLLYRHSTEKDWYNDSP